MAQYRHAWGDRGSLIWGITVMEQVSLARVPSARRVSALQRFLCAVLRDVLGSPLALEDFQTNRETRVLAHAALYLFTVQRPHVLSPIVFEWSVGGPFSDAMAALLREIGSALSDLMAGVDSVDLLSEARRSAAIVRDLFAAKPAAVSPGRWMQLLASLHFIAHAMARHRGSRDLRFDDPDVAGAATTVRPAFMHAEIEAGVACLEDWIAD